MTSRLSALFARKTVYGKVGQPREIALANYFLAEDEQSSFVAWQAMLVDGGARTMLSME